MWAQCGHNAAWKCERACVCVLCAWFCMRVCCLCFVCFLHGFEFVFVVYVFFLWPKKKKKKERKKEKKATPVPLTFPSCSHDELQGLFTCSWERFTDPCFVPKQSQKECRDIHKNNCSGTFTVIIVKGEMFFFSLSLWAHLFHQLWGAVGKC